MSDTALQEELDELGANEPEEVVSEEPVAEEPVVEEAQETPDAIDDEVKAEATEEPAAEEASEEDPVAALQKQIEAQQKLLEELAGRAAQPQTQEQQEEPQAPQVPTEAPQYITPEQFDDIQTNPERFNQLLHGVITLARQQSFQDAQQYFTTQGAQVLMPAMREAAVAEYAVANWRANNPVVNQFPQLARSTAIEIEAANPEFGLEEILAETTKVLNQRVSVPQFNQPQQQQQTGTQPRGGAFATPPRGARPTTQQVTGLQAELDAL